MLAWACIWSIYNFWSFSHPLFECCSIMFLFFIWLEDCFCLWKTLHYGYNCPVLIMTLVTLQYAAIILLSICFLGAGKSTLINILAGYKWAPYLLLLSIYIIKTAVFSVFCFGSWVRADIKRQGSWFFPRPGYFHAKIEGKKRTKRNTWQFWFSSFCIYLLYLAIWNLSDSPVSFYLQNCGLNKKFLPIGGITIDILIKKNVMKMHVILEHHTFPMIVTYP